MQRAVTVCRLDLAHPGTGGLHPLDAGGPPIPGRSALVHLSPRSVRNPASGGVCGRARRRTSGDPQPRPASTPPVADRIRSSTRLVPGGRSSGRRRTVVPRVATRRRTSGSIDHTFDRGAVAAASAMTVASPSRLVRMIMWYQRAMDGRPSPCRFTPSCSAYAITALEQHGSRSGLSLTIRRLLRCRPFGPSGWDPVPDTPSRRRVHTR